MATTATDPQVRSHDTQVLRARQQEWSKTAIRRRLVPVRRFRSLLANRADDLCAAVEADIGKPETETLAGDILPLAEACRFLEKQAARLLRPRRVPLRQRPMWLWGEHDRVLRRPRGVVGIIGTWNYPLFLNGVEILQAVTAGNAVLWKPSEVAPRCADVLWDLLASAGFPEGLLARLPATREAGRVLSDADVDHVVFTGHADTGRILAAHLGQRLVSSTLELSGLDPMVILDDADIDLAAKAAWFGATINRGQTCVAVRRVFVPRALYSPLLDHLRPLAASAAPVSLATPGQAEVAERLIDDALAHGARLLRDRSRSEPPQFTPAVVIDVRPEMAICREATFAPLMCVIPYGQVSEVLAAQTLCPYALGASVFTRDVRRGRAIASQLRAGMVTINDVIAPTGHPATPIGGVAASGWGVTHGAEGLLEMTTPQVVAVRRGRFRPHYDPPGSNRFTRPSVLKAMLQWDHDKGLRNRLGALGRLIRNLVRQ